MPNMYDGAMRYTATGTPRSTQTPSMYIVHMSGDSMLPHPSVSELADDIHTKCWPRLWITHIGILRLKLNTNTQIASQYIVN